MSTPISLNEVRKIFSTKDNGRSAKLRTSVPSYLIALTHINAAYPDPDNPTDFYWGRDGTFDRAQPFFS